MVKSPQRRLSVLGQYGIHAAKDHEQYQGSLISLQRNRVLTRATGLDCCGTFGFRALPFVRKNEYYFASAIPATAYGRDLEQQVISSSGMKDGSMNN